MTALFTRGIAAVALGVAGTALVLACGPFFNDLVTVSHHRPADEASYARGQLGVVKPGFERRYLVQAYRTMTGVGPLPAPPSLPPAAYDPPLPRWIRIEQRVLRQPAGPVAIGIRTDRVAADYSSFPNCLDSAFDTAIAAYDERAARYGAGSPEVVNWVSAQAAVFQNCGGGPLVLPPPPVPGADARLIADRDYQTAAAYFYAAQFDEAAGRFRAIASNTISPWRPYGRYLAARALIRSVTVPATPVKDAAQRLGAADRDLQATLADKDATALHASARGLRDFIAARERPIVRLHDLSTRLATARTVTPQDLTDYTRLMDIGLGETAGGARALDMAEMTKGDDLTDWIVATQRGGGRAAERWRETRAEPWLVAALWTTSANDAAVPALLDAAAQVPRSSPAFSTAAVLGVRLLVQRNDFAGARTALASLPDAPGAGFDAEAVNVLRAARFTVATTLEELLAASPRLIVAAVGENPPDPAARFDKPAWDDDVAAVFNSRMPLEQLVAAAESTRLPTRLRHRVAQAAFTRGLLLQRPLAAVRAAKVMAALETAARDAALRADLRRYIAATDETARARLGVLTLLRTPGLSINVGGRDDDQSYPRDMPFRSFGHGFPRNWWCGVEDGPGDGAATLLVSGGVPFPTFITEAERRDTATEVDALQAAGIPRAYLASAAIEWAGQRRTDADAAEALALAIEGWRWSPCAYDAPKSDLPRRAFALLHRQFPDSEWAKKTKYWYE
jgi:hypothetical protein